MTQQEELLELIRANPGIKRKEIVELLTMNGGAVATRVQRLKDAKKVIETEDGLSAVGEYTPANGETFIIKKGFTTEKTFKRIIIDELINGLRSDFNASKDEQMRLKQARVIQILLEERRKR